MNYLKINQDNTKIEPNVKDNTIELIYNEVKDLNVHDQDTLIGRVEIKHGYEDAVNFLNGNYSKFRCISVETPYIRFVDTVIEQYLINRLIESNMECDGIGITQLNLNQIRSGVFFDTLVGNTEITKFPEFNRLNNLTVINGECFRNCSNLKEINLENITSISAHCVFQNTALTEIYLPSCTNITAIDVWNNCTSLIEFNAPVLKNLIGSEMFKGCTNLKTVNMPQLEYIVSNNGTGNINQSYSMFFDCSELTTVNAPNLSITAITASMFRSCKKLENLNMDLSNITRINNNGFYQCHMLDLSQLSFEKITTIDGNAFTEDTLPETIDLSECTYIGANAFYNCKNLVNIVNTSNVTEILNSAFENVTTLTTFDDFSNITTIGASSFRKTALTGEINLSSCTKIRGYAFTACKYITKVLNTNNITYLGSNAFAGCTGLTQIGDLSNVTEFDAQGAEFWGCENLEGEINLSGTTNTLSQMIANFYNCKKVKRIKLGIVQNYGSRWNGFGNERKAFYNCVSMHTLDIKSLASLGYGYWSGLDTCTNLVNFIIRNTTVPIIDSSASASSISITTFSPNPNVKIYVPDEALNDYKAADGFSNVASYIYPLSEYIEIAI